LSTLLLVKSLLSKSNYNRFRPTLEVIQEDKPILDLLDKLHSLTDKDVTVPEMLSLADSKLKPLVVKMDEIDISNSVLTEVIKTHSERLWAYRYAEVLVDVFEGRKQLSDALQDYSIPTFDSIDDDPRITDDLSVLMREVDRSGGLKWRLGSLNKHVGGLHKGDFTIVFARPEAGKTTFCCSEFVHMSQQVSNEHPVLWLNNEERGVKVKTRMYQSALGLTYEENQEKYRESVNLVLYDKGVITRREVERLIKQIQPSLIVFDQIDKIRGFKADRPDLAVGQIYIWARELAKEYCPVIGVCQASASAENKKWLTMEDMSESKTSKPAEADLIIGLGHTDTEYEYSRGIHLIKNKITGSHTKITCLIQPEVARFKDT
jgi:replicative DNA helicase